MAETKPSGGVGSAQGLRQTTELTPICTFDLRRLADRLSILSDAGRRFGVRFAYSLKTNPAAEVLERVRSAGFMAEAINGAEVSVALDAGWSPGEVILNGPAKLWRRSSGVGALHSSMCDCPQELSQWQPSRLAPTRLGIRLRAVPLSRFGINLAQADERLTVQQAAARARGLGVPVALHCHVNSVGHGMAWWVAKAEAVFSAAAEIPGLPDAVTCIDVGGGWDAQTADELFLRGGIAGLLQHLGECYPNARQFIAEPGQSVVAPCGEVRAQILRTSRANEAIVDASVAELPFPVSATRPVSHIPTSGPRVSISGGGHGTIYGRSCMESDVLATGVNLSDVRVGDSVVFGDAGAYDTSLRNGFGNCSRVTPTVFADGPTADLDPTHRLA